MAASIDAHQHFWRYSPKTHDWIDDSMAALRRNFLPEDLRPLLDAAGIDGCIAVQAQQDMAETEWLLDLADDHDFIRGVVGWVDLRDPEVGDELALLSARPKLRGVRHIVQSEPDDRFMLQPDFMRGIGLLAEFGLTYDILIYPRQLPAAIELARAFPQQPFVLDHIAKPDIRGRSGFDEWARGIAALARSRNVYCKLSGMVTEADWASWSYETLVPYIETIFDWFEPERVMAGSDWPVSTLAGSYADVMSVPVRYAERLSPSERDAVLGGTAARFYSMG